MRALMLSQVGLRAAPPNCAGLSICTTYASRSAFRLATFTTLGERVLSGGWNVLRRRSCTPSISMRCSPRPSRCRQPERSVSLLCR